MSTTFLAVGLFFPRFLLMYHYVEGTIPANDIPGWADWMLGIFAPQVWIMIAGHEEMSTGWLIAYVLFFLSRLNGGSKTAGREAGKRRGGQ